MSNRITLFALGLFLGALILACFQRQYLEVTLDELHKSRDQIALQVSNLNDKLDTWQCQKLIRKR